MLKSHVAMPPAMPSEVKDFDVVLADPAAFYPEPSAIVADAGLTRRQRLQLLGEWAQDLVDRQVAENEGMAPERVDAAADDTSLLRRVNTAIDIVEASPEASPGLVARVWRRLTAI